jgi:hypothetical protein
VGDGNSLKNNFDVEVEMFPEILPLEGGLHVVLQVGVGTVNPGVWASIQYDS